MKRRAIIGGTGVYTIPGAIRKQSVETPYGEVEVEILGVSDAVEIIFLPRHGKGHAVPPHRINYRANLMALKNLGVTHIYATCAVGSCNPDFAPGDVVLVGDFVDFTKSRPVTFFEGEMGVRHTDMTEPYCPDLMRRFLSKAETQGLDVKGQGIYVCTEGPRFETAAEIAFYNRNGWDLVGMTNVPEVVLAKELGMCYSAVAMVTNYGTGLVSGEPVGMEEIRAAMGINKDMITRAAMEVLADPGLDQDACGCAHAVFSI